MIQGWVKNGDVKIHYLDNTSVEEQYIPLIIIPGLAESAEDYEEMIQSLLPRRAVVISLRGRGQSDQPTEGYTLEDHVGDIESVIDAITIDKFVMFGFSRGVSYTLGYAVKHPERIKGLIIGDYPAVHTDLKEGWAEFFASLPDWRGVPILQRMSLQTLKSIERESKETSFWEGMQNLKCPLLVIRGGMDGSALSEESVKEYLAYVPEARVEVMEHSNHDLFTHESKKLMNTIQEFFTNVEGER
ncbi:alpha/beta fold hydrolase [Peribacillus acanthi]|uniref:alpha/beta fold hydrolase n=1 Tax=Peribacillus acanthi TaxID=2171554 RepID=UPI000D3E9488|nr:alpha/beta hydrolase [Peribacillus acanthi]